MKRFLIAFATVLIALTAAAQEINYNKWMEGLDDNMFLWRLSIPAAHDAATSGQSGSSKTQSYTIAQQLEKGVRMFDLRPRWDGSNMYIYHGITKTSVKFNDALSTLCTCLDNNPTEFLFIIMRHEEDGASSSQKNAWPGKMYECLNAKRSYFVDYTPTLTVKEMRGKILLMSRNHYDNGPIGSYLEGGGDNSVYDRTIEGTGGRMNITTQDMYNVAGSGQLNNKVAEIKNLLDRSTASNEGDYRLYFNHTSGYSQTLFTASTAAGVQECAKTCNKAVIDYMNGKVGPMGFVLMDFAGDGDNTGYYGKTLIDLIINNNYALMAKEKDGDYVVKGEDRYVAPMAADVPCSVKYVRKEGVLGNNDAPDANWNKKDYDDSSWPSLQLPMGSKSYDAPYRYQWDGEYNTYWVRRELNINDDDVTVFRNRRYFLRVYHDDSYDIYVNGHKVHERSGDNSWTNPGGPERIDITGCLRPGKNVIATHIQQNFGGAYFDCGVIEESCENIEEANPSTDCILPSSHFGDDKWTAHTWVKISDGGFGDWNTSNPNYNKIQGTPADDADGRKWYEIDYTGALDDSYWQWNTAPYQDGKSYAWAPDGKFGDIYFRREFVCNGVLPSDVYMAAGHDDAPCEYYINGELIWQETGTKGRNGWYDGEVVKLTEAQRALIKTDGSVNVIAVHVHQNWGGYLADVGLYAGGFPKTNYDNSRTPLDNKLAERHLQLFNNDLNPKVQEAFRSQSIRDNDDALSAINNLSSTSLKARLELYDTDWHSFVAPEYNVDFTDTGVDAFKIVEVADGATTRAILQPVEKVEANQAVAVRSDNGKGVYGIPVTEVNAGDFSDNIFLAQTTPLTVGEANTIYCLSVKGGQAGFYPVKQGVVVPAYKGYLNLSGNNARPVCIFLDEMAEDDETAVSSVADGRAESSAIYSLTGQRVARVQKGIYVVDGKKIAF